MASRVQFGPIAIMLKMTWSRRSTPTVVVAAVERLELDADVGARAAAVASQARKGTVFLIGSSLAKGRLQRGVPGSKPMKILSRAFAIAAVLLASASFAQTITRGPFLQSSDEQGITVVFLTDTAAAATASGQPYRDAFYLPTNNPAGSEMYYSWDYGNAHFVCLGGEEK